MKPRSAGETLIICLAAVAGAGILTIPFDMTTGSPKGVVLVLALAVIALGLFLGYRYLTTRKRVQLELTGAEQYRQLAEEYRRLADMAITAQEHTDLKLGDVSAQLDFLREQNESLQKILKDVE